MPVFKTPNGLLFFAHVPRTAGTALEDRLHSAFGDPAMLDRDYRRRKYNWTKTSPQHMTWVQASRLFPEGFLDHHLSVVREPLARLRSVFRFQKAVERKIRPDRNFVDWLQLVSANNFDRATAFDNHPLPQSRLVPPNAAVFRIEEGLHHVETYLQETLGADRGEIPHVNSAPAEVSGLDDIGKEEIDLIAELYAEDYERFGYDLPKISRKKSVKKPVLKETKDGLRFCIQTMVPSAEENHHWGDFAFARSLAQAMQAAGYDARVQSKAEWDIEYDPAEIDIVLMGEDAYKKRDGHPAIFWVLYFNGYEKLKSSLASADAVLAGGEPLAKRLSDDLGATPVSVLPQGYDVNQIPPDVGQADRDGACFVGISRQNRRPIVSQAREAGVPLKLWGQGWKNHAPEAFVANRLAPAQRGQVYGGAKVVLNDHRREMADFGIPSNRIFDALAAGAAVISDPVAWLPPHLSGFVHQVRNAEELRAAWAEIESETPDRKESRAALAQSMPATDSFSARAARIVEIAKQVSLEMAV